jgi:aminoglycoside phosphotransferase
MEAELLKKKKLHYGDIHDCPMEALLIVTRILDKARRLVRVEYMAEAAKDFEDIPEVMSRIGERKAISEDTLADLKNYITLYEESLAIREKAETA